MSLARIPRISRMEYVIDFLTAIKEGLDTKSAEEKLARRKQSFESEKYKALGRGAPFSEKQKKRLMIASSLLAECKKLSSTLGLVTHGEQTKLTTAGEKLIALPSSWQKIFFAKLLLDCYQDFRNFLMALRESPTKQVSLPDVRHSQEHKRFRELARRYSLDVDVLSFVSIRDLLWQMGYVNWFPEKKEKEIWSTVYLTSVMEPSASDDKDLVTFVHDGQRYLVRQADVGDTEFSRVLWEEYLKKTKDVQLRPIFYSELRTAVCARLFISDYIFDQHIRKLMMSEESDLKVIWSSGTLPYSRDSASLFKNLPPKATNGQYMIYLKIGRK